MAVGVRLDRLVAAPVRRCRLSCAIAHASCQMLRPLAHGAGSTEEGAPLAATQSHRKRDEQHGQQQAQQREKHAARPAKCGPPGCHQMIGQNEAELPPSPAREGQLVVRTGIRTCKVAISAAATGSRHRKATKRRMGTLSA